MGCATVTPRLTPPTDNNHMCKIAVLPLRLKVALLRQKIGGMWNLQHSIYCLTIHTIGILIEKLLELCPHEKRIETCRHLGAHIHQHIRNNTFKSRTTTKPVLQTDELMSCFFSRRLICPRLQLMRHQWPRRCRLPPMHLSGEHIPFPYCSI